MTEIWKTIKDYPNYQISNLGRVKSLGNNKTRKEKILKSYKNNKGYLKVDLYKEGVIKKYYIHRLVASAFLDNPNNLPQVNHKDEDKTNNCVDNLEFCTSQYNINYGTRTKKQIKSKSKTILQFTKQDEFVKKWDNLIQIKKELGFDCSSIIKCCKGKLKTCGSFIWRYEEINELKNCA